MPLRVYLTCRVALVLSLVMAVGLPGDVLARNPVAPPGSRVALLVPAGFEPARGFAGFRNEALGASIVITELKPGSLAAVRATYAETGNPSVRRLSHTELPNVPNPGFLSVIRSVDGKKPFRKWVLAFDAPTLTGIVAINVPEESVVPALEAEIVAALASVTIVPEVSGTGARTPPFHLGASSRLQPVATRDGTTVIFAEGPDADAGTRFTAVAHLGGEAVLAPENFTRRMAGSVDGVSAVAIADLRPIAADGIDGYEASGRCVDAGTGAPCVLYQAILFAKDGYYRFVGVAAANRAEASLAEFRGLVAGFRRQS